MSIQRRLKNVVHNYTEAERLVREATSNDSWGPSSTLMAEIADKTHNVMEFTEIMQMTWRRLNDTSKNWRHVYKALVLLEYLIKTGSDKVAIQCKENIHSIETLANFDYIEGGKNRVMDVCAKAQSVCALLKDEERLHSERAKALLARERLMNCGSGVVSLGRDTTHSSLSPLSRYRFRSFPEPPRFTKPSSIRHGSTIPSNTELDSVRPQSFGEEQLQLQLAIAISKEEHDREERRRRIEEAKEESKLQMALERSRKEEQETLDQLQFRNTMNPSDSTDNKASASDSVNLIDTSFSSVPPLQFSDPWATSPSSATNDPFTSRSVSSAMAIPIDDPWSTGNSNAFKNAPSQPFSSTPAWPDEIISPSSTSNSGPFDISSPTSQTNTNGIHSDLVQPNAYAPVSSGDSAPNEAPSKRRTPADFLGEHRGLVDLDKLIEKNESSTHPFAISCRPFGGGSSLNPFLANQPTKPSLNQMTPAFQPPTMLNQPQPLPIMGTVSSTSTGFGAVPFNYMPPMQSNPWSSSPNTMFQKNPGSSNPFY